MCPEIVPEYYQCPVRRVTRDKRTKEDKKHKAAETVGEMRKPERKRETVRGRQAEDLSGFKKSII